MSRQRPGLEKLSMVSLSFSYLFGAWKVSQTDFWTAFVCVPLLLLGAVICAAGFAYHCMED